MLENGKNVNSEIRLAKTMNLSRVSTVSSDLGLQLSDMKSQADSIVNNITENSKNVNNEILSPMTVNLTKHNKIMAEVYGEDFYKYILKSEKETFDVAGSRVASDADGWYQKYVNAENIMDYSGSENVIQDRTDQRYGQLAVQLPEDAVLRRAGSFRVRLMWA